MADIESNLIKKNMLFKATPEAKPCNLQQAMQEAKSAYEAMRDVQEQLNQAYRDIKASENLSKN